MGTNSYSPSSLERARDELFSHIRRCGVLEAELDQREEWLADTVGYLAERYPDLSDADLQDLYAVGMRFCQPAIPHGRKRYGLEGKNQAPETKAESEPEVNQTGLIPQEVGGENTLQES